VALQSGKNVRVSYKLQPTKGTPPGDTGAKQLRIDASPGLSTKRALIENPEIRSDGQTSMPRLGTKQVPGSYNVPFAVGAIDEILEAIWRSTWVAAVTITEATAGLTSITTTTSTIVASAGSWLTAGIRVGDVIRLTNHSTAGNNSINLRVKSVSALTITVHGTPLTANAVADTAFTVTILKKLKNGATPTKRAFYIEQYNQETGVDVAEVFDYCRFIGLKITGSPNGSVAVELQVLGASGDVLASGASPYFTDPTLNTATRLVFADATLSYNGADVTTCQGFEISIMIPAVAEDGIGSVAAVDIVDGDMKVTGSLTFHRQDLSNVSQYLNETELELHLLLVEPETEPKDCISIYIPRVKLSDSSGPLGGEGSLKETFPFVTGKKEGASATGYDDTTLTLCTSAA
jgi:hypothetical protein